MTVESVTYISDLNTALPAAGDLKSEGDDHIRNLKIGVKGSFPNLVGAASPGSMGTSLGLVGTPSYSFTGDADTGMWSPGANSLAWSVGGVQAGTLASTGFTVNLGGVSSTATLRALSGNAANYAALSIGRASPEANFGVAATVNDFFTGTAAGDTAIQPTAGQDLWLGTPGVGNVKFMGNGVNRFVMVNDGRFYGTALHNNAGAVTGTTNQYVASGTYTPTLTNQLNLTSSTSAKAQWLRVGNVVHVSGSVFVNVTGAGQYIVLLSLPIASTFTADSDIGGTATNSMGSGEASASVQSSATDRTKAWFGRVESGAISRTLFYSFTYEVK
jgi:hypothetical protein